MAKTLSDLRDKLFDQIDRLSDDTKPLEPEIKRAKALSEVAQTIINGAKVQADFLKRTGRTNANLNEFFQIPQPSPAQLPAAHDKPKAKLLSVGRK